MSEILTPERTRQGLLRGTRSDSIFTFTVVTAFVVGAVWLGIVLNAWIDEAFSLATTQHGVGTAIERALGFEVQPPFYFAVLAAWRKVFGESLFAARALSALFATGALVFMVRWLSRSSDALPGWLAGLVVATHPSMMWAATEVRVYALVMLLSALLTFGAQRVYDRDKPELRQRALFVGLATIALYTQYYMGFLLAAAGLALLFQRRLPVLRTYGVDMGVVGLLALPLLVQVSQQIGAHTFNPEPPPDLIPAAQLMFGRFEDNLVPLKKPLLLASFENGWWSVGLYTLRAAVAGLFLWVGLRLYRQKALPRPVVTSALVVAGFALSMVLVLNRVGLNNVEERHSIAIILPLLATCFGLVRAAGDARALGLVAAALVATNLTASVLKFGSLAKRCDCRRVAAHLEQSEKKGEPILVFAAGDVLPLRLHYEGVNELVALPQSPSLTRFQPADSVIKSPEQVESRLLSVAPDPQSIWVFTWPEPDAYGMDLGLRHLETFLANRYRPIENVEFAEGATLRHLVRR